MKKTKFIVATRQSLLAMTQTRQTLALLERANPGVTFEVLPFTSTGDRVTDRPLSQMGGQGVFVKELESALSAGAADLAVHSLKDVPSAQPEGLMLAGFPTRENPFDILLCPGEQTLATLPLGAKIGTSSPRRLVQLKAARPDLVFADLRGNLDTRIRKLNEGQYSAILVAAAGMARLSFAFNPKHLLTLDTCVPAVGQGAIAIECRADDAEARAIAASITHVPTEQAVTAERAFMRRVGAGCSAPVAAYASISAGRLTLDALIGDLSTVKIARLRSECALCDAESAGIALAEKLILLCQKEGIKV